MNTSHEESNIISKLGHAFDGLTYAFKSEKSFRYLLIYFFLCGIPLIIFAPTVTTKLFIFHLLISSLTIELLNTAIEITIDRISLDRNIRSKRAKDVASGASLWWHLITLLIGILIAIRTWRDYQVWSDDFPNQGIGSFIEQTFQHN